MLTLRGASGIAAISVVIITCTCSNSTKEPPSRYQPSGISNPLSRRLPNANYPPSSDRTWREPLLSPQFGAVSQRWTLMFSSTIQVVASNTISTALRLLPASVAQTSTLMIPRLHLAVVPETLTIPIAARSNTATQKNTEPLKLGNFRTDNTL
ncbi:hypothetical protein DM02DRAFT_657494 [Periconia macrospinosa]|uniref:Uncharacterized protein n=1 Tax=Periconia macrospinosa TaxID=97972 RepID=A0A2V1DLY5_9PLEO|nr:hypothetical protein DM02DRAFT_657494 [Periconia macrospinosa]